MARGLGVSETDRRAAPKLRRHRGCCGSIDPQRRYMPMRAAIGEMARSYGPGTVEGAGDKGHQRFIVASDVCWK
jgi:hypothetical protein